LGNPLVAIVIEGFEVLEQPSIMEGVMATLRLVKFIYYCGGLVLSLFVMNACAVIDMDQLNPMDGLTSNENQSGQLVDDPDDSSSEEPKKVKFTEAPPDEEGTDTDGGFISFFKPALVVRGTGCIMCHGRFEANVVTDFGFGSDYYFGGQSVSGFGPFHNHIYGDHSENWQTAKIWGKIIAPRAPFSYQSGAGEVNTTLAAYLRTKLQSPDGTTPAPIVEEQNSIYIGAPTAERILAIAGPMPPAHSQWKHIAKPAVDVAGLELAPGNQYIQNTTDTELVCAGDLIIDGVLFLKNLQLRTDDRGCRIYVSKSVFIQGPITYLGTATYRNLQISSARAIVMGLGPGAIDGGASNTLTNRLRDFFTRPGYFTRDESGSTLEKLDRVVLDGSYIPDLLDASAQTPHGRNVSYERLFVNAPNYQSRYLGQFKGVIVSEFALGSLGHFAFRFDSVFETVPILPLLRPTEYFSVR
jgi:hypothetical protein